MVEAEGGEGTTPKEIILSAGETQAVVLPQGAYVARFSVGGKDILFPDQILEIEGKQKRRGGIPILFPQAGREVRGFELPEHGFAREQQWKLSELAQMLQTPQKVMLVLHPNSETSALYPYGFGISLEIEVNNGTLDYAFIVSNNGQETMPIAPGLHPYFAVPADQREIVKTNIRDFDINKLALGKSLHLPMQELIELTIPGLRTVRLFPGGSFLEDEDGLLRKQTRLIVWSDKEDYLCLEPWAADSGALEKPEERINLAPGEFAEFSLRIEVE